jgi:hypothetical protein
MPNTVAVRAGPLGTTRSIPVSEEETSVLTTPTPVQPAVGSSVIPEPTTLTPMQLQVVVAPRIWTLLCKPERSIWIDSPDVDDELSEHDAQSSEERRQTSELVLIDPITAAPKRTTNRWTFIYYLYLTES